LCIFDEIDVHEERLVVLGMLLDVIHRRVGLPLVEGRKRVIGNGADLLGRLAGLAFPLAEIDHGFEGILEFRIERREPGMEAVRGVVIGIDAGIVSGKMLHLVEAMHGRIGVRDVAEMPLAGEVGRVTVLLEELGDGRRFLAEIVLVAWSHHDRERRADRDASGDEGSPPRGATRLTVPTGEGRTLLGDAVDVHLRFCNLPHTNRACEHPAGPGSILLSLAGGPPIQSGVTP
jgi:hypothetical protein